MKKNEKQTYVNLEIKKVSEISLQKALNNLKEKNLELRKSFKVDKDTLSFRVEK